MLLDAMASSRAAMVERRTGMASHEAKMEKGVIQGELRRQLSVVNLRASMACMLDRLHQCGEGGRLRNRRQEWRVREEERMREEREMGDQFNWEVSSATWANTNQENICVIVIPNLNSAFIKVQFILFCSSKVNVYSVLF